MNFYKIKPLNVLVFCFLFLLSIYPIYSQENKVDLEVTAQSSSENVRGGETFTYSITAKNIGSKKASDVTVMNMYQSGITFVSSSSSKGNCVKLAAISRHNKLYCKIGDLDIGETVLILMEFKVHEFGDISQTQQKETSLFEKEVGSANQTNKNAIVDINISDKDSDDANLKNNQTAVFGNLLPSKNIPPRLEILSPKDDEVIKINNTKPFELKVKVKSFDLDGEIKRVFFKKTVPFTIETNRLGQRQAFYFIENEKVSAEEVRENPDKYRKYFETELVKTGKDLYELTITDLKYGTNRISIETVDNGGRDTWRAYNITIIGDSEIEIVSPKNGQVFTPNSTIKVTTKSQINDSSSNQIKLTGMDGNYPFRDLDSMKVLEQTKRVGNILEHQYVWKNVPVGIYGLELIATNDEGVETNNSERILIAVVEPSVVDIISIKDGQEFEENEEIKISVKVTDKNGKPRNGTLELFVDGKSKGEIPSAWQYDPSNPEVLILDKNSGNLLPNLEKGTHTIQVFSTTYNYGFITGKSKPIKIAIK